MSSDPTGWHVYRGTGDAALSPIADLPGPSGSHQPYQDRNKVPTATWHAQSPEVG